MNRSVRRRRDPHVDAMPRSFADSLAESVDHILAGNAEHVLLGPVVLDYEDTPYFFVGSSTPCGKFRVDQLKAADRDLAETWRRGLLTELIQRRPIVIHDFDDELEMARWAAVLCPGEKTSRILAELKRERGVA